MHPGTRRETAPKKKVDGALEAPAMSQKEVKTKTSGGAQRPGTTAVRETTEVRETSADPGMIVVPGMIVAPGTTAAPGILAGARETIADRGTIAVPGMIAAPEMTADLETTAVLATSEDRGTRLPGTAGWRAAATLTDGEDATTTDPSEGRRATSPNAQNGAAPIASSATSRLRAIIGVAAGTSPEEVEEAAAAADGEVMKEAVGVAAAPAAERRVEIEMEANGADAAVTHPPAMARPDPGPTRRRRQRLRGHHRLQMTAGRPSLRRSRKKDVMIYRLKPYVR